MGVCGLATTALTALCVYLFIINEVIVVAEQPDTNNNAILKTHKYIPRRVQKFQPRRLRTPALQTYVFEDAPVEPDQTMKRDFDDYGHMRFGKRDQFDDYGHMRFGRSGPVDDDDM